jgi:hypothetical protein
VQPQPPPQEGRRKPCRRGTPTVAPDSGSRLLDAPRQSLTRWSRGDRSPRATECMMSMSTSPSRACSNERGDWPFTAKSSFVHSAGSSRRRLREETPHGPARLRGLDGALRISPTTRRACARDAGRAVLSSPPARRTVARGGAARSS